MVDRFADLEIDLGHRFCVEMFGEGLVDVVDKDLTELSFYPSDGLLDHTVRIDVRYKVGLCVTKDIFL